ncbi:hypothetical protein FOXYSP1_04898 [Fusarium oxysporum f. sp. phaseoli]
MRKMPRCNLHAGLPSLKHLNVDPEHKYMLCYLRRNLVEVTIFWRAAEEDLAPKLNENEELKLKLEAAESAAINQQASKSTEQHRV